MANKNWADTLSRLADELARTVRRDYVDANIASVEQLIRGIGPDDKEPSDGAGACMVVNIAAAHIPDFCEPKNPGDTRPYKNAYQIRNVSDTRQSVDDAIVAACAEDGVTLDKRELCFAAVETNGTGIRFFGDMCMVLRFRPPWLARGDLPSDADPLRTLRVLERNSYDVSRAPVAAEIENAEQRAQRVGEWLGSWERDLIPMLASRIAQELPATERRWTSGQIARAVLDDEDYCEVLYPQSFGAAEIAEVRVSAADVAAELDIARRQESGEGPAAHETVWREQRRDARRALQRQNIPIRVVTSHARRRGS